MNIFRNLLAGVIFTSFLFSFEIATAQSPQLDSAYLKFIAAMKCINTYYVDSTKPVKLTESAIIGMLKELDPHSAYLSKDEVIEANEPLQGSFDGIGIQFQLLNDTIFVVAVITGGPSEKLGILSGDKIVKIEGADATGKKITNSWVLKQLRGPKGTVVKVGISRKGEKNILDFNITRDKIPLYSVDATFMATPETGYIKLERFASTSIEEFNSALKKLKEKGAKNLILDLRGNSGGYLNTAVDLGDEFIERSKTIVYTEGLNSPRQYYKSSSRGNFKEGKLVILIDEGSASASEIVSGAIQDWDRGLIIGRRSFGKGLVQRPFDLTDGSIIRLTTARYYTPTGRCIQKSYKEGVDKYFENLAKRAEKGELYNSDSIHFPDSLKYYTPNKRLVYGGGGIMPDIFIPLDTSEYSKYLSDLYRKGIFNQFSLEYVFDNKKELQEKYPTIESFKKNFKIDSDFLKTFIKYAEKKEVKKDDKEFKTSERIIITQIKALIARNLFDMSAYFEVIMDIDKTYQKAISVLQDNTFKKMKIREE
ncbi:MAG: S41 family peptidase [Bacteroidales bacterium]|nr:S41 family peptidase [Bacteroidales bacterium]